MVVYGYHTTHVTTIKCSSHAATVAVIVGSASFGAARQCDLSFAEHIGSVY
jgi:nicotinamide mononucleotide adenylyltransferase